MQPRTFRRTALSLGAVVATLVASVAPAQARPDDVSRAAVTASASPVFSITDSLARQLARTLADPIERERIVSAVANRPADLLTLTRNTPLAHRAQAANQAVLAAKGLPATSGALLRLRVAHSDMLPALARGVVPLTAAAPTDDVATDVIAYDQHGRIVRLDPRQVPRQPVLLVEVDVAKALPLGLALMRRELAARGMTSSTSDQATMGGYWALKVNAVYLSSDHEPWAKGAAEIYTLAAGFGHDGKADVDLSLMPYLDHDKQTYYPNQTVVHFSSFKYNLADLVMMEDDGDTNYQALVIAIVDALLVIADGGAYVPLVNAVLEAIPGSWYTDDPDYVDSWYTLATNSSGRHYGAARNGWIDLQPYWVSEL